MCSHFTKATVWCVAIVYSVSFLVRSRLNSVETRWLLSLITEKHLRRNFIWHPSEHKSPDTRAGRGGCFLMRLRFPRAFICIQGRADGLSLPAMPSVCTASICSGLKYNEWANATLYYMQLLKLFKGREKKTTGKRMFLGALIFFSVLVHDGYNEYLSAYYKLCFLWESWCVDELKGCRGRREERPFLLLGRCLHWCYVAYIM